MSKKFDRWKVDWIGHSRIVVSGFDRLRLIGVDTAEEINVG